MILNQEHKYVQRIIEQSTREPDQERLAQYMPRSDLYIIGVS